MSELTEHWWFDLILYGSFILTPVIIAVIIENLPKKKKKPEPVSTAVVVKKPTAAARTRPAEARLRRTVRFEDGSAHPVRHMWVNVNTGEILETYNDLTNDAAWEMM